MPVIALRHISASPIIPVIDIADWWPFLESFGTACLTVYAARFPLLKASDGLVQSGDFSIQLPSRW